MAVNLSPIGNDAPFVDASGKPLSGGKLYTYTAGSTTAQSTYTTSAGSVANANPIVLDSNGYPASGGNVVEIWLTAGVSYKFVLETSASVVVWTRDNISGINDTTVTIDQWVAGPAPTYISATSFSLVGDQTSTFTVGRRVKTTNSGGTIYSTILTSAFTTLTTVTIANDSGTLDSGLSAVSYGLLDATNPSTPLLADTYPIVSGSSDKTKKVRIEADGLTTATTRVWTAPDANITLGSFADSSDATKKVAFGLSGITTGTTRTLTVPDADLTIAGIATSQTLTNKTIVVANNALDMSPITNSISGNVALNNTSNYFDGPSVAQGTSGKWFVCGTVTVQDPTAAIYDAKLWDGTTVIASARMYQDTNNTAKSISLSGYIDTPAGNLRISVRDGTNTTGNIISNATGNSKDSTITAIRIG